MPKYEDQRKQIEDKITQIKAQTCEAIESGSDQAAILSEMQYIIEYLLSEVSYIENKFYEHMKGHIPKINSVSQLRRAIEILELDSEYNVEKKTIYSSRGKNGEILIKLPEDYE